MVAPAKTPHFERRSRLTPDPHTKELFDAHLAKGDELAAKVLVKDPKNVNAIFAQAIRDVVAHGHGVEQRAFLKDEADLAAESEQFLLAHG